MPPRDVAYPVAAPSPPHGPGFSFPTVCPALAPDWQNNMWADETFAGVSSARSENHQRTIASPHRLGSQTGANQGMAELPAPFRPTLDNRKAAAAIREEVLCRCKAPRRNQPIQG